MPIEFLDLLDDDGWIAEPLRGDQDDGRLVSTAIDPTFGLTAIRLPPGYRVARHRYDQQVLRIVFGGSFEVRCDDSADEGPTPVGAGQFCVVDADTVHELTVGPDGVTYTESWHLDVPAGQITWEQP